MSEMLKPGTNFCRCPACGQYFNSPAAFDKHRSGKPTDRYCLSIDQMVNKGMSRNKGGYWITQTMPESARNSTRRKPTSDDRKLPGRGV